MTKTTSKAKQVQKSSILKIKPRIKKEKEKRIFSWNGFEHFKKELFENALKAEESMTELEKICMENNWCALALSCKSIKDPTYNIHP